jgi:dihydroorotase
MQTLTIPRMFDAHVHLRECGALEETVAATAAQCDRALVMPNLSEAITTPSLLREYREVILAERDRIASRADHEYAMLAEQTRLRKLAEVAAAFEPLMTFEIREDMPPEFISSFKAAGAVAGKVYPHKLTTNSQHGVQDYTKIYPVLEEMQKEDLVLCLHGEQPGLPLDGMQWLIAEQRFLMETLAPILRRFPRLRVTLEHISTFAAVDFVVSYGLASRLRASITAHHLVLNHDMVGGYEMNPNNFCKPVAKRESDRLALVDAATSGDPKFFFGSDSAPHPREGKERLQGCCAGCYTAPIAAQLLAQVFDREGRLENLEAFTSRNACDWYRQPQSTDQLTLVKEPTQVPHVGRFVPFMAGKILDWSLQT